MDERTRRVIEAARALANPTPSVDPASVLFGPQQAFVTDTSRQTTAVCTRKAGKTFGCAARLLKAALAGPGHHALYITLSRINAKAILWDTLKQLNRECCLGGDPNESELTLTMPNGSRVYLAGAKDSSEIEKFRGLSLALVLIDEAQSFPVYLKKLVDEILVPNLMVFAGTLALIGTPGPVPIGYFYECAHSPTWTHHAWSAAQNIHLEKSSGKTFQQQVADELTRTGKTVDDPSIQREWFGRWVLDPNSLVFRFDPATNARTLPPFWGRDTFHQNHVIGLDFGFDDADAIDVLGWSDSAPEVDLVHEWVGAKQNITALCERVKAVYDRFKPLAVVADTGGLGKKIADEIAMRTGIPLEPADKLRKLEHIEWVNDALRTHRLYVPPDSRFAQDALLLEWDKSDPEKPKISDRFHSDTADGLLYAFVRALHWLHVPASTPPPKVGTVEWREAEAKRQEAENEAMLQADINAARERRESDSDIADIL